MADSVTPRRRLPKWAAVVIAHAASSYLTSATILLVRLAIGKTENFPSTWDMLLAPVTMLIDLAISIVLLIPSALYKYRQIVDVPLLLLLCVTYVSFFYVVYKILRSLKVRPKLNESLATDMKPKRAENRDG